MDMDKLMCIAILLHAKYVVACPSFEIVFAGVGATPVFRYTANVSVDGDVRLSAPTKNLLNVSYASGVSTLTSYNGCSLASGHNFSLGILNIRLDPIHHGQEGIYQFTHGATVMKCIKLFIYGQPNKLNISSNVSMAYEGQSVTLRCHSVSTTVPGDHNLSMTYEWKRGENVVTSDGKFILEAKSRGSLTIMNVVTSDTKYNFTCRATEDGGNTSLSSDAFYLKVVYGPNAVTLSPSNLSYALDERRPLNNISCFSDCYPGCTYTWLKGGVVFSSGPVLSLGSLLREEAGNYVCRATNSERPYISLNSSGVIINVRYGPDAININVPSEYRVTEGVNTLNVTCTAICWQCTFSWENMTTGTIVTPTNVLVLGPVDRYKAGVYMCKAINHWMTHSRNISTRIIVNYGPDSVNANVSSKFIVTEGHVAPRITCTTSCWPECTYTWRNATSGATMATSRVLDLGHVNRYMTATYTCKASNNDISLHKETNITMNVYYGPDRVHVSQPSEFIVTEGQLAPNITCKGDCLPECLYSWTNMTSGTTVALRESLVLGHANRYMAGVYMCKANNAATSRNVNGSTRMFVIYGPDSLNFNVPRQYTVTEGEVVPTVTCSADCWPGCTYTWRNMTYGDTLPNTGMLTLGRVNKYAAGEYSCDAYNNGNGLKKSTSIRIIVNYASIDSHQQTIFISAVTGGCGACIVILIAVVCCCRRYRHRCTRTGQQNESAIIRKDTAASHFSNAETITNAEHTYTGLQRDQQNVRVVEYQNVTVEPTDHDYEQLDDDLYVNQLSIS